MSDDTRPDAGDPTPRTPDAPTPAPGDAAGAGAPSGDAAGTGHTTATPGAADTPTGGVDGPTRGPDPAPPPPTRPSPPPMGSPPPPPPPMATPPPPGAQTQGAWGPPGYTTGGMTQHPSGTAGSSDSRQMAMFAHLSAILASFIGLPFIGPLVIWLMRKDQDPYVAEHGREALNANISYSIYMLVGTVVTVVLSFILIGFLLIPLLALAGVGWLVLSIIAGIKANNGEHFKYPLVIRFVS